MNTIHIDPWIHHGAGKVPTRAALVCAYHLYIGIDTIDEQVFFRRTAGYDELWVQGFITGLAVRALSSDEPFDACLRLFALLIRSRAGHGWPTGFQTAGLLNEKAFGRLLADLVAEMDDNSQAAESNKTEIVAVAQELDLSPEPTGTAPRAWQARCPETNHKLQIDAETNLFFCGWCRRKGGPPELRALTRERKQQWKKR